MADTGYPATDGLQHLKTHLTTLSQEVGAKVINLYPKAQTEGISPPCIDIVFMRAGLPAIKGLGTPCQIEHRLFYRLWYYSERFTGKAKWDKILEVLEKIQKYLIENPKPDSYGDLIVSDSEELGGLNIEMGEIFTGKEMLSGGYIDLVLKVILSHTIS